MDYEYGDDSVTTLATLMTTTTTTMTLPMTIMIVTEDDSDDRRTTNWQGKRELLHSATMFMGDRCLSTAGSGRTCLWGCQTPAQYLPFPMEALAFLSVHGPKNWTQTFFLQTFRAPLGYPDKNPLVSLGFEGHTELFGPHPFTWKTPTPPEDVRTEQFGFGLLLLFFSVFPFFSRVFMRFGRDGQSGQKRPLSGDFLAVSPQPWGAEESVLISPQKARVGPKRLQSAPKRPGFWGRVFAGFSIKIWGLSPVCECVCVCVCVCVWDP